MVLRNGISLGIRKKHIRIGKKFDCVEGVTFIRKERTFFGGNLSSIEIETWLIISGIIPEMMSQVSKQHHESTMV